MFLTKLKFINKSKILSGGGKWGWRGREVGEREREVGNRRGKLGGKGERSGDWVPPCPPPLKW